MAGCGTFIGLCALDRYAFGFRVWGEPGRLLPELYLVLILAGAPKWRAGSDQSELGAAGRRQPRVLRPTAPGRRRRRGDRDGRDCQRDLSRLCRPAGVFDPSWRAYADGRSLPIRPDAMDFLLIDVPPGEHDTRLVFETPLENAVGRAISVATLLAVAWLFGRSRKAAATVLPSQFAC